MQSTLVVVANVAADERFEFWLVKQRSTVNHFRLHRMEERLYVRIVVHVLVHALDNSQLHESFAKGVTGIFDAAIRVKHQAGARSIALNCAIQGTYRQLDIALCPHTPSEHLTRTAIHHGCEISPRAAEFQIGNVTDPDAVWCPRQFIEFLSTDCSVEFMRSWVSSI